MIENLQHSKKCSTFVDRNRFYMLIVLLLLWSSVAIGYFLRHHPIPKMGHILTFTVWFMLLTIGIEVGGNKTLVDSLGTLGWEAFILTLLTTFSCGIGSLLLWLCINSHEKVQHYTISHNKRSSFNIKRLWSTIYESLIIFISFAGGCLLGYFGASKHIPANASFYALCLLLICVGLGIGQNNELRQSFRNIKRRYIILPIITIICTWVGALFTSFLFNGRNITDWITVSSGFGYYSLSSMLITETRSIELGTMALIHNVMREITVLLFAPLLLRLFGPLAPISIGGATTADTTLPTISRISGMQFVPIAIFHGLLVDLSVPLLVPLFCAL